MPSMSMKERARLRVAFLAGDASDDAYHAWLKQRILLVQETWVHPEGVKMPPSTATIRHILRVGLLGSISIVHLCVVFQTAHAFWYLDDDATIEAAAKVPEQINMVLAPAEVAEWVAKHNADAEKPHQRGAEMAAAFT